MTDDRKQALVTFVVQRAFDPVLHTRPEDVPQYDQVALRNLQKSTRAEIERFRGYRSAEAVVTNFKRDLHSAPAWKVHAGPRRLCLLTIADTCDEFDRKAEELGIRDPG